MPLRFLSPFLIALFLVGASRPLAAQAPSCSITTTDTITIPQGTQKVVVSWQGPIHQPIEGNRFFFLDNQFAAWYELRYTDFSAGSWSFAVTGAISAEAGGAVTFDRYEYPCNYLITIDPVCGQAVGVVPPEYTGDSQEIDVSGLTENGSATVTVTNVATGPTFHVTRIDHPGQQSEAGDSCRYLQAGGGVAIVPLPSLPPVFTFDLGPGTAAATAPQLTMLAGAGLGESYPSAYQIPTEPSQPPQFRVTGVVSAIPVGNTSTAVYLKLIDPPHTVNNDGQTPNGSFNDNGDPSSPALMRADGTGRMPMGGVLQTMWDPTSHRVEAILEGSSYNAGDNYRVLASFDPSFSCQSDPENPCAVMADVTVWSHCDGSGPALTAKKTSQTTADILVDYSFPANATTRSLIVRQTAWTDAKGRENAEQIVAQWTEDDPEVASGGPFEAGIDLPSAARQIQLIVEAKYVDVQTACFGLQRGYAAIDCDSCKSSVGDPVSVVDGNMRFVDADPLPPILEHALVRTFDSGHGVDGFFGIGWTTMFDQSINIVRSEAGPELIHFTTPENQTVAFQGDGVQIWPSDTTSPGTLIYDESFGGYAYRPAGGRYETRFDPTDGFFVGLRDTYTGRELQVTRNTGLGGVTITGMTVVDSWTGMTWTMVVSDDLVQSVTATSIGTWTYVYDQARLSEVHGPGGSVWRTYGYGNGGISEVHDAAGNLLESHQYDASGRAITSIGPSDEIANIEYDLPGPSSSTSKTRITTAAGGVIETILEPVGGSHRIVKKDGGCSSCGSRDEVQAFDPKGLLLRRQDASGYIARNLYDQGRLTQTESYLRPTGCDPASSPTRCRLEPDDLAIADLTSTAASLTRTYDYEDGNWPSQPTRITTSSALQSSETSREEFIYDAATGRTLQHSVTGWTGTPPVERTRTSTTTYYDGTEGPAFSGGPTGTQPKLVKRVDGPRTDVDDVTEYVYYPADSSSPAASRGRLAATRNGAGHITRFEDYDVFGNARRIVEANGVATESVTDAIGRVSSSTLKAVGGCNSTLDPLCTTDITTTRTYTGLGPLVSETRPGGGVTAFTYDARGRLRTTSRGPSVSDLREQIELTYDAGTGKKSVERYLARVSGTWAPKRTESYAYDGEGRLQTVTHGDGTTLVYTYDYADRIATTRDENHSTPNTTYTYDPAGRLKTVVQTLATAPGGSITTSYNYDSHGNLDRVTDPNGNVTEYVFDDFGQMLRQESPVTGATTYSYDAGGNLTTSIDANGATTTRTFDVIGRPGMSVSDRANQPTETVTWTYDNTAVPFGVGRLSSMTDPTGSTSYRYDRRGLLSIEEKIIDGTTHETAYKYDHDGNRVSIQYPSGRIVGYIFDYADRPVSATSGSTNLVQSASYLPFGPRTEIVFGNGTRQATSHDARYRVLTNGLFQASSTIAAYSYDHDAASNIRFIHDDVNPAYNRDFAYDDLNRLVTANSGPALWGNGSYSYDSMGNLQSSQLGAKTRTFSYAGTTPKLTSVVDGATTSPVVYDASGNEVTAGQVTSAYSARNQMLSSGGNEYRYDGRGIRVVTTPPSSPEILSFAPSVVSPQPYGTSILWTTTATGGVAPLQYRFSKKQAGAPEWALAQDWSPASTYPWTPAVADVGNWEVRVEVRSFSSAASQASQTAAWTVIDPITVASLSPDKPSPQPQNTTITWTAQASGGNPPLEFQFMRKKSSLANWTVVRDWSTAPTYVWTPGSADAGTWDLKVNVRSAGGTELEATRTAAGFVIACVPQLSPQPVIPGGDLVWIDDSLPAGASLQNNSGTSIHWDGSQSASGTQSLVSSYIGNGTTYNFFINGLSQPVAIGENVVFYLRLNECTPPSDLMILWYNTASGYAVTYWAASGSGSAYMGPLPAATGDWLRVEIPASRLHMEQSTVTKLAITYTGGQMWFDHFGKSGTACIPATTAHPQIPAGDSVWIDDSLPAGASLQNNNSGTMLHWEASQSASGTQSLVSTYIGNSAYNFTISGLSQPVAVGENVVFYVRLNECAPPSDLTILWFNTASGYSVTRWAASGSGSAYMGPMPAATGDWVRIEIPASQLHIEQSTVTKLNVSYTGGQIWFDHFGKSGTACVPATTAHPQIPAGDSVWIDDSLPAGASLQNNSGASIHWDGSQSASGTQSLVLTYIGNSAYNFFINGLSQPVAVGENVVFYVRLNECAPPSDLMIRWFNTASGYSDTRWGASGSGSSYMGPMPAATGDWVRIEIPASQLHLEQSTVTKLDISYTGGQMWFDHFGKSGTACVPATTAHPQIPAGDSVWIDDSLPAGASLQNNNSGTTIHWDGSQSASGSQSLVSTYIGNIAYNFTINGLSQPVAAGENVVFYVRLNECAPPSDLTILWFNTVTGYSVTQWAASGSGSAYMGPMPAATGEWVRIEIPASQLPIEQSTVTKLNISYTGGQMWFDHFGKAPICQMPVANAPTMSNDEVVWIEDQLPGQPEALNWSTVQKASGTKSIWVPNAAGAHEQSTSTPVFPVLSTVTGDKLTFYMLLNPCVPPREILVSFGQSTGGPMRGVRWGEDLINKGTNVFVNQGAIPAGGTWHRFEFSAAALGLENADLNSLSFALYDGEGWLDRIGRTPWSPGLRSPSPEVTSQGAMHRDRDGRAASLGGLSLSTGAIPAAGGRACFEIPASSIGLENMPIDGLQIRLNDGEGWFDRSGVVPQSSGMSAPSTHASTTLDEMDFDGVPPVSLGVTTQYIDTDTASSTTLHSIYTPELSLLAEVNVDGTTASAKADYVWFGGQPIAQIDSSNSARYYFDDHLGTPILQTDASAAVVWRAEYEPYGAPHVFRVGAEQHQPLRFPGQENDGTSDTSYNIFRWNRSGWGRYTQADRWSFREPPYAYVLNNPVVGTDRTGQATIKTGPTIVHRTDIDSVYRQCDVTFGGGLRGCTQSNLKFKCNCHCSSATMGLFKKEISITSPSFDVWAATNAAALSSGLVPTEMIVQEEMKHVTSTQSFLSRIADSLDVLESAPYTSYGECVKGCPAIFKWLTGMMQHDSAVVDASHPNY